MNLIESERLYVRYYTPDDLDNFYRLNGDEDIMRYIRAPKSREECETFLNEIIQRYQLEPLNLRLALLEKSTGEFVGSFAIIPLEYNNDTQLGYALLKEHWGKGYATEIVQAGLRYIYGVLHLSKVYAVTQIENVPSQKVLLKNGFVFEKIFTEGEKDLYLYFHEG